MFDENHDKLIWDIATVLMLVVFIIGIVYTCASGVPGIVN